METHYDKLKYSKIWGSNKRPGQKKFERTDKDSIDPMEGSQQNFRSYENKQKVNSENI